MAKHILSDITAFLFVMMTLCQTGSCLPVASTPWSSPCASPSTSISASDDPFGDFSAPSPTMAELTEELHSQTVEAYNLALSLRDLMFQKRLDSSNNLAQIYEGYHLENFPLTSDVIFWTSTNITGKVTEKDYENLSTVLVFLEAIKNDDIEYHNATLKASITSVEKKILSVLCALEGVLSSLDLNIDDHVGRDVMPNSLQEITSDFERHKRDYVAVKDMAHLFTRTKSSHLELKEAHTGS